MATIFCFSTTGNSLYAANKVAQQLNGNVLPMNLAYNKCDDDVIGFVFPVYFLGLPKTVEKFITNLEIVNKDSYIFAIFSYGGYAGGMSKVLNNLLIKKGVNLKYSKAIKNVDNYILKYKAKEKEKIRIEEEKAIDEVVFTIKEKETNKVRGVEWINKQLYKLFPGNNSSCDENFNVLDKCIGCSKCKSVCPASNIEMDNNKPMFNNQCEHCLACVQVCPVMAIQWSKPYKDDKTYVHPKINRNELTDFCISYTSLN